jgi:hypothetical protein
MIICDECNGWPLTYFVEMIGETKRRTLCPTCAALRAAQYVARAKRRTERERRSPPRRKIAQEATQ